MSPRRGGRKCGRVHSFRKSSSLTLLALLAASPSAAETAQPPEGTELPRVVVTSPPPSGRSKAGRPKQAPAVRPPAGPATPVTTTTPPTTPLNTNTVTEVGGPLGLTARQTPATVEIVDQQLIREQGYRNDHRHRARIPRRDGRRRAGRGRQLLHARISAARRSTRSTTASRSARLK